VELQQQHVKVALYDVIESWLIPCRQKKIFINKLETLIKQNVSSDPTNSHDQYCVVDHDVIPLLGTGF